MKHTTSDDNKRNWKIGDWCWGDAAATRTFPTNNVNSNGTVHSPDENVSGDAVLSPPISFIPAIAASSSTMNSNSPSATSTPSPLAPSVLKREQPESISISMPQQDAALSVGIVANANTTRTTTLSYPPKFEPLEDSDRNTNTLYESTLPVLPTIVTSSNPTKIEPSEDHNMNTALVSSNTEIAPPSSSSIPTMASWSQLSAASSGSAALSNGDGVVSDSFVSSSSTPDFSGSATNSPFSLATTARKCDCYNNGGRSSCCRCRGWKTGDWYWWGDEEDAKEEQEEIAAEGIDVKEEQEAAISAETPSSEPICTHLNPKQSGNGPRQTKRKANAATSPAVEDEDGKEDYEGDSTVDLKEEYGLSDGCSTSEIQSETKRARKRRCQNTHDKQWEEMFQLLLEYKDQHGNTLVPAKYNKNTQLGGWVSTQRYVHSKKKLSSNRVLRLESIGFVWCVHTNWDAMYQLLLEYKDQHGNTLVPAKYNKNTQLGIWVYKQRHFHSKRKLLSKRVLRLESIGFVWCVHTNWDAMYQLLLEYKTQHGNTLVPKSYNKSPQLGGWVSTQRCLHSKKKLSSSRVLRLESIGFVWCIQRLIADANWEAMYQLLLEYKDQHGNTLVPRKYNNNTRLGHWVCNQRHLHSKKELSSNRVLRLESIGFVWCIQRLIFDANWDAMYQLLLEYKDQHGNTLVPRNYNKNTQLGIWVYKQRHLHSKKKLLSNRVLRLESIGFVWCIPANWDAMYQLLLEYKDQHGNTLVPKSYNKSPQLGRWVSTQRCLHSKKKLSSSRVLRLESIEFVWCVQRLIVDANWDAMYQLLLEYKDQHGNTLVPRSYNKSPQLGRWVGSQRCLHSKKELSSNRVLRLESIGFVWCIQRLIVDANWDAMYQLLLEYKDQHGNTLVPRKYNKNTQLGGWVSTQRYLHSKKELSSNRVLRLESIGFAFVAK